MTAVLEKRRAKVLTDIADEHLAEQDAAEARRQAAAEAERVAKRRHAELSRRRDKLVQERLEALTEAENNCRAMIKAMGNVLQLGADASAVYNALGERPLPGLAGESCMRMLGEKLSAVLKPITKNGPRLGTLMLARTWRQPDQSWAEDTIARVGRTEKENGNG